jgi:hypothetical protein
MTAGSGVLHEELHSSAFRESGGLLEMVQLWVNLPAKHKLTEPAYQTLLASEIRTLDSADGKVKIRVVAGTMGDTEGPARTFTPVNLYDVNFEDAGELLFEVPDGFSTAVFVMDGFVTINGTTDLSGIGLAVLERQGTGVRLNTSARAHLLVMSGEPIDEPVVGYGPFVMNTHEEISQALSDFSSGRFAGTPS